MTYSRNELIDQLQNETEIILNKVIYEWQIMPHASFAKRPSPKRWSANECLQHLNSYGNYYLPALERALDQASSSESDKFTPGWLGNYFTNLMHPGEQGKLSMKMKSPKDYAPKTIIESYLVISEFIDQQEKLLQLLARARAVDLNKRNVSISIASFIKLKIGDVFMFFIAHIARHVQQADRALMILEKPEMEITNH